MRKFLIGAAFLCSLNFAFGWTKTGTVYTATGVQSDFNSAEADASTGDTINLPSGSYTWGASGLSSNINKAITVAGAGTGSTTIVLSATGPGYGSGVLSVSAAANVSGFTITGVINTVGYPSTTPFTVTGNGWRIHHIIYNAPVAGGYFAYCSAAKGLFDHITINSQHGSLQTFTVRGLAANHLAAHTMGSGDGIYIENSTFNGPGYVFESEGGGQVTARFNTITGDMYFDPHQFETSTSSEGTQHGARQSEVYDNTHTTSGYNDWTVISGGTGMFFDNYVIGSVGRWQSVNDYGAHDGAGINTDGSGYIPTPAHSPIPDQIGTGRYVGGVQTAGDEPVYFFNNVRSDGTDMFLVGQTVSSAAIAAYGSTFYMTSPEGSPYMFLYGRDYLNGKAHGTFPSTSQIGRGTYAQMLASSPTAARQGWYVTDRGSWNHQWTGSKAATAIAIGDRCIIASVGTTNFIPLGATANTVGLDFIATAAGSGTGTVTPLSGQLFQWNGSAWNLYYEPYGYPHTLQAGGGGGGGDTTPPTPNPSTITGTPTHTSSTISVTETTATDETALATAPYSFSNDGGGSWTADQVSTSYTWTGLTPSTLYQVKVRAKDLAGNITTPSTASPVTTDAAPTSAPKGGILKYSRGSTQHH